MINNKEELEFWSGNPEQDICHGLIRVKEMTDQSQNTFVACTKIPTYLHIVEFCHFIEQRSKNVNSVFNRERDMLLQMRVLKSSDPKSYIVVLKFSSPEAAYNFGKEIHRRKFNEIEAEACDVSWLEAVYIEDSPKPN